MADDPSKRWLHGPVSDLVLGCGLWYMVALAALVWMGPRIREAGALTLIPFLTLVFGTPHYGATLLRVYQRREDRRAYALFAVWITLMLAVVFVLGVHHDRVGSWILTVYLTWSPWHYTGQNYGIAVMFLRRRQVPLEPPVKRVLYLSFLLSFLLTFLAQHAGGTAQYAPVDYAAAGYQFLPLGIPAPYGSWAIAAVGVAYVASLLLAAVALLRRASAAALLPAALLALSQALWFSVPLALRHWELVPWIEPWSSSYHAYYFMWIAIGHSVQYVWVTSYYDRSRAGGQWMGLVPYLAKVMLAGAAIWVLPALVFAPGALGRLPFYAGLSVLVAATVNIHHFILDGAIWKLRDGRVARVLLRPRTEQDDAPITPRRGRIAPAVWATGAVCTLILFGGYVEQKVGFERALNAGDVRRARQALDRLSWVGRDSALGRRALGDAYAARNLLDEADRAYARSLELQESAASWIAVGGLREREGRLEEALAAYQRAVELAPERDGAWHALGRVWLDLGKPERARDALARAAELAPERRIHEKLLRRAEERLGESVASGRPRDPAP